MEDRIRQTLQEAWGQEVAEQAILENLGGHASLRIYWRITLPKHHTEWARGEHSRMAMVMPLERVESAEVSKDGELDELPFINVHRLLETMSLPVGAIDVVREDLGVLILEDLGDVLFENLYLRLVQGMEPQAAKQPVEQLYHRAINLLVSVQRSWAHRQFVEGNEALGGLVKSREFDADLLMWELEHYLEWGVEAQRGELDGETKEALKGSFEKIVSELIALPTTMVLRDYQSRNIMEKQGKLVLIDFQDALIGPVIYDLVALLRDSYIALPFDSVKRLVDYYITQGKAAGLPWCDDKAGVHRAFHLQTVQRKLKDSGRFIFIDRVKQNPSFLDYYNPSIGYVRSALGELEDFRDFATLLAKIDPVFGQKG